MPLAGIEPALLAELDFESSASTNSATGAFGTFAEGKRSRSRRNIAGAPCRSTRGGQIAPASGHRSSDAAKHPSVIALGSTASGVRATTLQLREIDVTFDATASRSHARQPSQPALTAALSITAIAAATLAGAWFFQLVLDILPCELCLAQRYAYYLAIPLGALTALAAARGAPRAAARWRRGAILASRGARQCLARRLSRRRGMALFWPGPDRLLRPDRAISASAGNLLEQLDKVKVIRCDEVQFRFLGLSLAGYSVLISLLMAAVAAWGSASVCAADRALNGILIGFCACALCRKTVVYNIFVLAPPMHAANRPHLPAAVRTDAQCRAS